MKWLAARRTLYNAQRGPIVEDEGDAVVVAEPGEDAEDIGVIPPQVHMEVVLS